MVITETIKIIVLPSGQYAAIDYTMDVGQMVIILLLAAMILLQGVSLWISQRSIH